MNRASHPERPERLRRRLLDDAAGVPIERVGRAVRGLRRGGEEPEERRSARTGDERPARAGQQTLGGRSARGRVQVRRGQRQDDVEPQRAERALERREDVGVGDRRRRGCAAYLSWNGYGVVKPSDGGKTADLTAFSTQEPVGVPANLPDTVALETLPLLPMTTFTIAMP
jgi:hypothetical protein